MGIKVTHCVDCFYCLFYVCAIYFSNVCKWGFYYLVSQSLFLVLWLFQTDYTHGTSCAINRHYPWLKRGKYKNDVPLHIIKHIVQFHLVLFCEVQNLYTFCLTLRKTWKQYFLNGFYTRFCILNAWKAMKNRAKANVSLYFRQICSERLTSYLLSKYHLKTAPT